MKRTWLTLLFVPLLLACGAEAEDPTAGCARAVARINECAGSTIAVAPAACDPEAAAEVLARSCAELTQATVEEKADGPGDVFRAVACGSGFLRHCSAPPCAAAKYPALGTTCIDYKKAAGCGGCQFYNCRDAQATSTCGSRGYYLGFGGRYCERFLVVTRPRVSAAGQRFLDTVRDCLVNFLDTQVTPSSKCADVKTRAFNSHIACYRDSGFCSLPLTDQLLILNTVDLTDIDFSTILRTGVACLSPR